MNSLRFTNGMGPSLDTNRNSYITFLPTAKIGLGLLNRSKINLEGVPTKANNRILFKAFRFITAAQSIFINFIGDTKNILHPLRF